MPLLVHLEIIALDRFTIAVMTAKDLTRSSVVARQKSIMTEVSHSERILTICLAVLILYRSITDGETKRRTDGITISIFINECGRSVVSRWHYW